MDNFGTNTPGALYEVYPPKEAKRIWIDLNLYLHQNTEAG